MPRAPQLPSYPSFSRLTPPFTLSALYQIKSTINGLLQDQMRAIWNTWLMIQVLLFCFTICAIAAASDTSECQAAAEQPLPFPLSPLTPLSSLQPHCGAPPPLTPPFGAESVSYGFFAIWTVLCCCAYTVGGTMVLRNLEMRTPLAVGFMLGVGVTLVNMLLVLAVMSGEGPLCDGKPTSVRAPSGLWRHATAAPPTLQLRRLATLSIRTPALTPHPLPPPPPPSPFLRLALLRPFLP